MAFENDYYADFLDWNGSTWTVAWTAEEETQPFGVSCTSRTFCMAIGEAPLYDSLTPVGWLWNGKWPTERYLQGDEFAFDSSLSAVSCASNIACTAVGQTNGSPLAVRWNGTRWLTEPTPFAGALTGVSCTSRARCMAIGDGPKGPLAARYG